jgi:hypothetical protein
VLRWSWVGAVTDHVRRYERDGEGSKVTATPQLALPIDTEDHGEIRLYRIVLPYLPPSKNVWDGWKREWQSGHKKKWLRDIKTECDALQMPRGLWEIGLAATLIFPSKNRRDPQNYSNCLWNFVPDALVRCGVLMDDREGAIQIGSNWGIKFAYDTRNRDKKWRQKTVLNLAVRV